MSFQGHQCGECHGETWLEKRGDTLVGMARNVQYDGAGRLLKDETSETGVTFVWEHPPKRSLLQRLFS